MSVEDRQCVGQRFEAGARTHNTEGADKLS